MVEKRAKEFLDKYEDFEEFVQEFNFGHHFKKFMEKEKNNLIKSLRR